MPIEAVPTLITGRSLQMYTIYDHPKDYPSKFVVRRFENGLATQDYWLYDTLEAARKPLIGLGAFCLQRTPADDPVIIETWL